MFRNLLTVTLAVDGKEVYFPYTMVVGVYPPGERKESLRIGEVETGAAVLLVTGGVVQVKEDQRQLARDVDTMIQRSQASGTRKEA